MCVLLPDNIDKVLTINDWWDGPRLGLATFNKEICIFECIFSETEDDYTDLYHLTPIEEKEANLILLDWNMWCKEMSLNPTVEASKAFQLKHKTDLPSIAAHSSNYHKYIKQAVFHGKIQNFYSCLEKFFVEWK